MKKLLPIIEKDCNLQLKKFLNCTDKEIPLILPQDFDMSFIQGLSVPDEADFGVASGGTTGKPKVYFRTKKSWEDFFKVQSACFDVNAHSRIFIHGSLAFTGNLNIALMAVFNGNFLYTSSSMRVKDWSKEIEENEISFIYLIPDKIKHLCKGNNLFSKVKTVLCGSQYVSKEDFLNLSITFPNAKIYVYYGSSEVSYISYKCLNEFGFERECVGKTFDGVKVSICDNNHILVNSPYCALGIDCPWDTKDLGYFKGGLLYMSGRSDDVINISGQKINRSFLEDRLLSIPEIKECVVSTKVQKGREVVVAHIAGRALPDKIDRKIFEGLSPVFIPVEHMRHKTLPRNEIGKLKLNFALD